MQTSETISTIEVFSGKSDLGMSFEPYVFAPKHLFVLVLKTNHGNSFLYKVVNKFL